MKIKAIVLISLLMIFSFSVLQAEVIMTEDFEGDVSSWTFGTSGQTNMWACGTATSHNGSKSAYISSDGGANATYVKSSASESWLERSVDLTAYSSANLSFYWKCDGQGGVPNRDYGEVYINNGINHLESGYREFEGQSTWIQKTNIDLSSYVGYIIVLKFKWVNNSSAGDDPPFSVDDIEITGTPGHDFATLSYSEDNQSMDDITVYTGSSVQFNIVAKNVGNINESSPIKWICDGGTPTSDTNETTGSLAPNDTENHIFLPNWTAPATPGDYTLKFYTDLANDFDHSNDTTYVNISVLAVHTIPFTENFDSTIPTDLPEGWTWENANSDVWVWFTADGYAHTPSNRATINGINLRPMDDWMFSCPLEMNAGTTYRVSFWAATSQDGSAHKLEVLWGDSPSSVDMINGPIFNETFTSNAFTEKFGFITPTVDGVYFIGWHGYSDANFTDIFIDDIDIKEVQNHDFETLSFYDDARSMDDLVVSPNSIIPISIAVRNLGSNPESSPIKWSVNGGLPLSASENTSFLSQESSEKYIFSTNWTAPATPGTYTFQIYTDLSTDTDNTNDQTTIEITVCAPASVPFSENFDGVTAPALPTGWSTENTNRDYREWSNEATASYSSPNSILINENPYLDMNDWVFTCPLTLEAGKIYDLSFMYSTGGLEQNIEVKWGTNADSDAMTLGQLFTDTTGDASYQEGNASFSPATSGTYYLGWHGFTVAGDMAYSILYFDDVSLTEADTHDFALLSYDEDNRSMDDMTVLINSSVQFNIVAQNVGSYTESSPIKWNCTGGTPTYDSNDTTTVLAPDETDHHTFSPNWTAPATPGTYTVNFYTDLNDDIDSSNDTVTIEITVLNICNALPISEGFESGLDVFVNADGNHYDWEINSTLYHSGGSSAWNDYTNYDENILIQDCVMDLSGYDSPYLSFWHIAKTEAGLDGGYIEVSTDLGESWIQLTGTEYFGASDRFTSTGYFDEACYSTWGTANETPTNDWWKEEIFDFSAYNDQSEVMVRFRLATSPATNRYGWLIDDITIKNLSEPEAPFSPQPESYSSSISPCLDMLEWTNGFGTSTIDLFFGTDYTAVNNMSTSARVISNQNVDSYEIPITLECNTVYYWKVLTRNSSGTTSGGLWRFTTLNCDTSRFEDFETGDFSSYAWVNSGDADWFVQSSPACEGTYSAQSGAIGNSQTSELSIDLNLTSAGYVSFCYMVDSEENYDKLIFSIDGVEQGNWSGDIVYGDQMYYVYSGLRSFKWYYEKNVSGSVGDDAAWIDCICFPPFSSSSNPPAAPENLTITVSGDDVLLNWDNVNGAISYKIYRSEYPDSGFLPLDTSGTNSYSDIGVIPTGTNYYYYVTAVNSAVRSTYKTSDAKK
ncbi:MAG: hypothetical protein K8S23_14795 [Candidatus Cloacimonetes bacterium]|nr:hypothetical protein [Candidatus Cloacimonadota bacterium]